MPPTFPTESTVRMTQPMWKMVQLHALEFCLSEIWIEIPRHLKGFRSGYSGLKKARMD